MGLDMYLNRFPRYKDYDANNIMAYEDYLEWKRAGGVKEVGGFDNWGRYGYEDLPTAEDMEYFDQFISTKYCAWDEGHTHPRERIYEQVGYWRKANAVHEWFVVHVQDYEDDCQYHHEVTRENLEELRDACKRILEECVLVKGKIKIGSVLKNGKEMPRWKEGLVIANPEICKELLPSKDGFFFGKTGYDEWYMKYAQYTFEAVNKVLEETDFEKQMIYYRSSW